MKYSVLEVTVVLMSFNVFSRVRITFSFQGDTGVFVADDLNVHDARGLAGAGKDRFQSIMIDGDAEPRYVATVPGCRTHDAVMAKHHAGAVIIGVRFDRLQHIGGIHSDTSPLACASCGPFSGGNRRRTCSKSSDVLML